MKRVMIVVALGLVALLVGGAVLAAASASPEALSLTWWTVDGGGQTSSQGGEYTLGGTAGQPDAGVLSGGQYTLGGGFWRGGAVAAADYRVYLPIVMRGYP
jgi:hypothetical protein